MKPFVRAAVIAVFVLVIAVTPLSAITSGGHFEYRYPARGMFDPLGHRVTLDDRTRLAAGIGPAQPGGRDGVTNLAGSGNWLLVEWSAGGCDTTSSLLFERSGAGYQLTVTSGGRTCAFLSLMTYAIVVRLWSPIDASTVEFAPLA